MAYRVKKGNFLGMLLSTAAKNKLKDAGIMTREQFLEMTPERLLRIKGLGVNIYNEIAEESHKIGMSLKNSNELRARYCPHCGGKLK
jgi:DNA-directed RNA polymerase alpha subunit